MFIISNLWRFHNNLNLISHGVTLRNLLDNTQGYMAIRLKLVEIFDKSHHYKFSIYVNCIIRDNYSIRCIVMLTLPVEIIMFFLHAMPKVCETTT